MTALVRFDEEPRSVLVVLPTWVGDFVMATPTLRALRRRFATARITFLMEPNLRELVHGGDWMDECLEWPPKSVRKPWTRPYRNLVGLLREQGLDLGVLLPNAFSAGLITRLAGAKRRVGYDRDGRGWLLTDRVPVRNRRVKHEGTAPFGGGKTATWRLDDIPDRSKKRFSPIPLVEYYADLAEVLGCERPGHDFELFTTPDAEQAIEARLRRLGLDPHPALVVFSPGAKYGAAKCWPTERFAALADRLIERNQAAVIITCGPGEEPIAHAIADQMKQRGHVFDNPLLSLGELKSLIRRCRLLVCNDAGPRHFAKAFRVPVATVFGPTHPAWTATDYPAERILRIDIECGPCQERVCPLGHLNCMKGVTVDAVFQAATELLSEASRPTQLS